MHWRLRESQEIYCQYVCTYHFFVGNIRNINFLSSYSNSHLFKFTFICGNNYNGAYNHRGKYDHTHSRTGFVLCLVYGIEL